ncbi:MAG: hypothetical protein ACR2Q4_14715 [Geminicoccaceae bacterium]
MTQGTYTLPQLIAGVLYGKGFVFRYKGTSVEAQHRALERIIKRSGIDLVVQAIEKLKDNAKRVTPPGQSADAAVSAMDAAIEHAQAVAIGLKLPMPYPANLPGISPETDRA